MHSGHELRIQDALWLLSPGVGGDLGRSPGFSLQEHPHTATARPSSVLGLVRICHFYGSGVS